MTLKQFIIGFFVPCIITLVASSLIILFLTYILTPKENKNIKEVLDKPVKVLTLRDDQDKVYYVIPIQRHAGSYERQAYEIYEQ